MHPIFRDARRLGLYLLAWIPLCALMASVLAPTHLNWRQSFAMCIPLCLVYAFVCLAAAYVCRSLPIREGGIRRLITTQALNAVIGGGIWLLLAKGLAWIIAIPPARMSGVLPLIFLAGVMLYLLSVAIHYAVFAVEASHAAQRRESEATLLAGKAELRALRAQINPHFLYNSLNSISALTSIDPGRAREMCIQLSEFLRNTLGMSEQSSIPLSHELELVRSYLAIERVRFGKRLEVGEQIAGQCERDAVPPLILQPLVENAIVHGISNVLENGFLKLTAEHVDGKLRLIVENSYDPDSKRSRQAGFGLDSIRKRLKVIYGPQAGIQVSTEKDQFRVEILLPRFRSE